MEVAKSIIIEITVILDYLW